MQCLHPFKHLPGHISSSQQARVISALSTRCRPAIASAPLPLPVTCFFILQEPCRAALPAASLYKVIRYRLDLDVPYCSMRPCMPWAENQSAQSASYRGAITPRESTSQKIASSTISKCRVSQERTSRNNTKMGMSMPGCPISPCKTRLSRLNCHSSQSWCTSCSLSQARLQLSQGKNRQLAHLRSHLSQ